jgi:hypothetical protein
MIEPYSDSGLRIITVSSSTLDIVSRMHDDTPSCFKSPGKNESVNLRKDNEI